MPVPEITAHARTRMQQRGIRTQALEALLAFGSVAPAGRGGDIVFFDKKARRRLARKAPAVAREAERLVRTYAIVGADGTVVTIGHRYRRIPRK